MRLYKYENYEDYIVEQVAANKAKLDVIWVSVGNVDMVSRHFNLTPLRVLCHGTRNAAEQKLFAAHWPDAEIIGTEISDTANQFPMTVQHDMHEPVIEWIGKFDVVYSNAFDHACDPVRCLETWLGQLAKGGRLYVDFADDPRVNYPSKSDPLALDTGDMEKLVALASGKIIAKMDGQSRKAHTTIYVITT